MPIYFRPYIFFSTQTPNFLSTLPSSSDPKSIFNACLFIKSYLKNWPYYKNNDLEIFYDNYKRKKNIQVIGTPKNIGQVKYIGQLLNSLNSKELDDTAVVLADETMLIPLINSIPQNVKNINVTMGYPLKNSNIFSYEILFGSNSNFTTSA